VIYDDEHDPKPPPPVGDSHLRNDTTLVVMIAALRERRCPQTLLSMFKNASHPARVYVALVQQNDAADPDCLERACDAAGQPLAPSATGGYTNPRGCSFFERVRVRRMLASEAKGPLYARALQRDLIGSVDQFCMQIDAHTEFSAGWDVAMLGEWAAARNE